MKTTNNYILTESLLGGISIYMILKRLMTEFSDWDAFKLGIIDKDGNKLKHPISSKEREAWDILTRFCWNIKKITTKFIGKSKFASYFTAAYLLKDSINLFYIEHNKTKLNETLLSDITFKKQLDLHNILKQLPIVEGCNEETLEVMMFKYMNIIEKILINNSEIEAMFEEEGAPAAPAFAGTVATDIAQANSVLGGKLKRFKKSKKKKEIKNESN